MKDTLFFHVSEFDLMFEETVSLDGRATMLDNGSGGAKKTFKDPWSTWVS